MLYLVFEEYMGKIKIIGIFKSHKRAKEFANNYSSSCYIKRISTDLFKEVEENE